MAVTKTKVFRRAQRISPDSHLQVINIALSQETYGTGIDLNWAMYVRSLYGWFIQTSSGYIYNYDPTAKKLLIYTPAASHAHAVELDGGVTGAEAAHTHAVALDGGASGAENAHTHAIALDGGASDAEAIHTHAIALDGGVSEGEAAHTHAVALDAGASGAGSSHNHGIIDTSVGNEAAHTHAVALDGGVSDGEAAHTHAVALDGGVTDGEAAHTHAVALDGGVSAVPSATAAAITYIPVPLAGIQNALTGGSTCYIGPTDNVENANEDICFIAPLAGNITAIYATLGAAPGAGESVTLTVRRNAADQAVTMAISGVAVSGNDTAHSFAVAVGDKISVKSVATSNGSFAAADLNMMLLYAITAGTEVVPTAAHTHGPGSLVDAASGAGSSHTHGPGSLVDAASGAGSSHTHGPGSLVDAASGVGASHTHSLTSVSTGNEGLHTHGPGSLVDTASAGGSSHTHGPGSLVDAASGGGSSHTHGPGSLVDAVSGGGSSHTHGPGSLVDAASAVGASHTHGPGSLVDAVSGAGGATAIANEVAAEASLTIAEIKIFLIGDA